jgi:predicted NBD/HSP70 family sugar kinase
MEPDEVLLRPAERLIITVIADERPSLTRTDLGTLTGLPRTTVIGACKSLVARGLLREEPSSPGRRGRPASGLSLAAGGDVAVVNLKRGGSTIQIVSPAGLVARSAPLGFDAGSPFAEVRRELMPHLDGAEATSVVISVPAPIVPGRAAEFGVAQRSRMGKTVIAPAISWLTGDASAVLSEELRRPLYLENDANLAALGESAEGAGRDSGALIYLDLKYGIGAGIVISGEIFRGGGGIAGEIAHSSIDSDGSLCFCGNRGCLVAAFTRGPLLTDQLSQIYGADLSIEKLEQLVTAEEPAALRALTDYGRKLGAALSGFVSMFNPDMIVVDGRIQRAAPPLLSGIAHALDGSTHPSAREALILTEGTLGDSAVAIGGALLARRRWVRDRLLRR